MSAFLAMLVDAYRQLNAKKLFWITLFISGIVVLFYASISFNETGMSMLFGLTNIENEFLVRDSPMARMLYRGIFSSFIVSLWLAWVATILALISTTTVFPDFMAPGAIDVVLAKPISRVRLFAFKYLTSLLFVLLQVGIFCVGVFICMGWRLGDWNWMIFAAVPLVTLFYSYLYAVNVLVAVVTRSALAALLMTMLFWFSLFGVNAAETMVNQYKMGLDLQIERADEQMGSYEARLDALTGAPDEVAVRERIETSLQESRDRHEDVMDALTTLDKWHGRTRLMQAILPKTGETIALLDRWLAEETDVNLLDIFRGNLTLDASGNYVPAKTNDQRVVEQRMLDEFEGRSYWYIIGSSLLFELVVLGIACFVFVRRDY